MGVDNSRDILDLLCEILVSAGYSFVGETNPRQTMSQLAEFRPDLLLVDIEMPEMDGFELCREIRATREYRSLPIAFLTGRNGQEDIRSGIAAGGNDYIVKPFAATMLLRHVNHWAHRTVGVKN